MPRVVIKPFRFEIEDGDGEVREYVVPQVPVDDGITLAELMTGETKSKLTGIDLFKLAMGVELYEQLCQDRVPMPLIWRAGMAATAYYRVLLQQTGPDAYDQALQAANIIWESGLDPEALAARVAAAQSANGKKATTKPTTRTGAASSTRSPASGTGTSTRPARKKTTGSGSKSPGRGTGAAGT
ncbi:MAG TPA: hypothetical protein VHB69_10225 [Mycobacteriales bacterium]|nr:hypothetical protein [Mycobacteriales bacterium]